MPFSPTFSDLEEVVNKELTFGGVISDVQHRVNKNGTGLGNFYSGRLFQIPMNSGCLRKNI